MVYTKQDFNKRVSGVDQKQSKLLRRGYTTRVDRNGIIIAQAKPRRFHFPVKGIGLIVIGFFCFKAFMLAANGPDTYQDRLAMLQNGTAVEALGARVLSIDPVTQAIADHIGPLLR